LREKEFPGGSLTLVGANAPSGLASIAVRRLGLDEVDRFPMSAGTEGDPVRLAEVRTSTFFDAKIFMCSTPTIKDVSRIEKAFKQSDQRYYWVPCPECDERQILTWDGVQWESGQPETACYQCEHCEALLPEHAKPGMLAAGQWRASVEGNGETIGFHLSSLYSPWLRWSDLAREFLAAQGDPALLQPFVNTRLGEVWDQADGDRVDGHELMGRAETWPETGCPLGVTVVTAGIDVQDDRLEVGVWGWGIGKESWSLDHLILWGDVTGDAIWRDLDEVLRRSWPREDGQPLRISAATIDSGAHAQLVYGFTTPRHGRKVWAVKGRAGDRVIWPKKPSRNTKGGHPVYIVGVDEAKQHIYSRLRREEPGPGYVHISTARDVEWYEQLTAERRRTRFSRGHANHYWWKPGTRCLTALCTRTQR
jgi:phage terminase large subunit GpA-like protein